MGFALGTEMDPTIPANLVLILTPLVVFGVGELVKLVKPLIPGWAMVMVIIPALSGAVTWASTFIYEDKSWLVQFGFGLLSVVIHQLTKQLSDKKKIA